MRRLISTGLHFALLASLLAIAIGWHWTLYEVALLMLYDTLLVAGFVLVARPLTVLDTGFSVVNVALGEDESVSFSSIGLLLWSVLLFLCVAADVALVTGVQAINLLPAATDALEWTDAWRSNAQGIAAALAIRAIMLALLFWPSPLRRGGPPAMLQTLLAPGFNLALLTIAAIAMMLFDDLVRSTTAVVLCLLASITAGTLLMRVSTRQGA